MKRNTNRLKLARKTIRRLDARLLSAVAGGGGVLPTVTCTQNPDLRTSAGRLGLRDADAVPTDFC